MDAGPYSFHFPANILLCFQEIVGEDKHRISMIKSITVETKSAPQMTISKSGGSFQFSDLPGRDYTKQEALARTVAMIAESDSEFNFATERMQYLFLAQLERSYRPIFDLM